MNVLVTGATGNVGSLVVERLIAQGGRPRVFVRDAAKARARFGDRVDVAVGDLEDAPSLAAALPGADALFLVNSGPDLALHDEAAAHVARLAGLKHLVKLSSIDALEQNVGTGVWHARGETAIRASGVPCTFVQPSGFMSNALYWARSIKAEGVVRASTGDGRIPFIHPRDIAEVSVVALTTSVSARTGRGADEARGTSLPITGPAAMTYGEMTDAIGAALGRRLAFVPISEDDARAQQAAWGAPPAMVEARLSIFRAIRGGRLAAVMHTVERTLGRPALTFARWAQENVDAFR